MINNFIYKVCGFVIILCLINLLLDFLYRKVILEKSIDYRKTEEFNKFKYPIDYLILGDSYFENAIYPDSLEGNAYNYTMGGETYIASFYKLRETLKTKKVKNVIVPANLITFSDYRIKSVLNKKYWLKFCDFTDLFTLGFFYKNENFIKNWMVAKFFSYQGNYMTIYQQLYLSEQTTINKGYIPIDKDTSGLSAEIDSYIAFRLDQKDPLDSLICEYFDKLLNLCEKNNIKVFVLTSPVTPILIEKAKPYITIEKIYEKINPIIKKYKNVTLLNYLNEYANKYDYFYNPDHLNKQGAAEFSHLLNNQLKSIAIKN
jgi:hypothetical protein